MSKYDGYTFNELDRMAQEAIGRARPHRDRLRVAYGRLKAFHTDYGTVLWPEDGTDLADLEQAVLDAQKDLDAALDLAEPIVEARERRLRGLSRPDQRKYYKDRDRRMRETHKNRPESEKSEAAIARIAKEESLKYHTARKIIYGIGPYSENEQ